MKDLKFYRCKHCKNLVELLHDGGVPMICCGEAMEILAPNTVEAATEKHIPDVTVENNEVSVKIGSVPHPMLEEHHIEFIYLQTQNGGQRKDLVPGEEAVAVFALQEDKPVAVYEYCNLHGLWKKEL